MLHILLVCGTGASSGFMAKNIRKAAKEENLEINVKARSDSEIEEYIESIDLLLVGPHLRYMLNDLLQIAAPYHVPVRIIDERAYGSLDGKSVLDFALKCIQEEGKKVSL
ncbi:PTS sugar transporter subunit IIB [Holdemania filiformis]|uniref:PTS sugar transporter subunit IIB n=1 Tax=Holdemania filiformis TaxID=61171 RepID=A0A412FQ11_9FIRM|nr:PTS sugar transporter subunit IIB [Holdemania filiformis]MBS5003049.1 PTS sugar transporter subunit IIB [Holdemania filiformis]RGR70247.1 PTS sugar transporter subunit IIB [Holdemania filiformis]